MRHSRFLLRVVRGPFLRDSGQESVEYLHGRRMECVESDAAVAKLAGR
jgi:hypothetical protein